MLPKSDLREEARLGRTWMSEKELGRVAVMARVQSGDLKLGDAARLLGVSYRRPSGSAESLGIGEAQARQRREDFAQREAGTRARKDSVTGARAPRRSGGGAFWADAGCRASGSWTRTQRACRDVAAMDVGCGLGKRGTPAQPYRQRRERRRHFVELVQLDGRHHDWMEERGPRGCSMNMVDDATGYEELHFAVGANILHSESTAGG